MTESTYEDEFLNAEPEGAGEEELLEMAEQAVPAEDEEGNTAASVFEYASATYQPTPRPGENPAAVTDAYLAHAPESLRPQSNEAS